MSFVEFVADELEKVAPNANSSSGSVISLHQVVRRGIGTDPDWPLLAYRNFDELETFVETFYHEAGGVLGSRADRFDLSKEANRATFVEILRRSSFPKILKSPPIAIPRPGLRKVQGSGKFRAIVAAEVASISHVRKVDFAVVIGNFLIEGEGNRELVTRISRSAVEVTDERQVDWAVAKRFSHAMGIWMKTSDSSLVADFCFALFENWSGVQDQALLKRISNLVPVSKVSPSD